MAVEVSAGEGLVSRRAVGSRDPVLGIGLLAVALVAAFGVRAATGAHVGSPVRAAVIDRVVQAPVNVVTTNQIPPAPPLELPKVASHPARRVAPQYRAAVHVTTVAAVTAPVTHSSAAPPTSTGESSGTPSVASGSTGVTGSGTGSVTAPSTSQPTHSGSRGSGTATSGGSSSQTSSGGGGSSNSGTLSGGG